VPRDKAKSANKATYQLDELHYGFKDDRMINDHEIIEHKTTQMGLAIMSPQLDDDVNQ
jgi:hypothetical protein